MRAWPIGRRSDQARRSDRGAAAVEFALILPILVLLLFGIVDFGRLLRAQLVVTEAAREAARASALVGTDAAQDRADELTDQLSGGGTTDVSAECTSASPTTQDTTVTVTYDFEFITPLANLGLGGADGVLQLTATSVMPCLR